MDWIVRTRINDQLSQLSAHNRARHRADEGILSATCHKATPGMRILTCQTVALSKGRSRDQPEQTRWVHLAIYGNGPEPKADTFGPEEIQ